MHENEGLVELRANGIWLYGVITCQSGNGCTLLRGWETCGGAGSVKQPAPLTPLTSPWGPACDRACTDAADDAEPHMTDLVTN